MKTKSQALHLLAISLINGMVMSPSYAMIIHLNDIGGAAPGSLAGDAFIEAATIWSSVLVDPIEINLDVGFSTLGSGILGSTSSSSQNVTYTSLRTALINDVTSIDDQTAVNFLQAGPYLNFLSNQPNGTTFLDNNNSTNNQYLSVNTANLKALGLLGTTATADGSITFNNTFSFDFDGSDGISAGTYDFVGIALHEIGHALGFVSGSDTLDVFSGSGPNANQVPSFDPYSINTTLDLFRYSNDSIANGISVPDIAAGDRNQYFSINGGTTQLGLFSTGKYNGDGKQTSHWKDNLGLGILDPTFSSGELGQITALDLLAFDAIGYDIQLPVQVGNVNTALLLGLPLGILGFIRTRRKRNKRKK